MKKIIILLLILFISGLPQIATRALAQNTQAAKIGVRHLAPAPTTQNGKFKIEAFVEGGKKEGETQVSEVYLWFRLKDTGTFKKIKMQRTEKNNYETVLSHAAEGLEYYIEVLGADDQRNNDGSADKPYFFQSVAPTLPPPFQLSTANTGTSLKKPFWKKAWFWLGMLAVIGGGAALAGGGGDKGEATGTVTVN